MTNNPFASRGGVAAVPSTVLATDENRLKVEQIGRASLAAEANEAAGAGVNRAGARLFVAEAFVSPALEPISVEVQREALKQVDEELTKAGLLTAVGGVISQEVKKKFSFERCSSLPTPGLLVKGCIDDCNICEPEVQQKIKLELEQTELQNKLLKKKIDLLEKSQEYRCCPAGETEEEE